MFDSGVRGGADIFKALALGAKFVFVGRLYIWGLSIMGAQGVRHVMKSLLADFDILLNVAGFQNIDQIDRNAIGKFKPLVLLREYLSNVVVESYQKNYTLISEKAKL
jgi:isopentenyl diphosphate isomerase/L-lactate dehydrogenase-like FMN-dependent dehydrogenase